MQMFDKEPDEIVTIAHCRACEQPAVPTDLDDSGAKLRCHRCGMKIKAGDLYDYADLRVVEYE